MTHLERLGRPLVAVAGAALVVLALTGRGALFVRPWFLPVLVVAGIALAVAAWRGGAQVTTGAAALLLLPVVVAVIVPSSAVGNPTARSGSSAATVGARFGDPANPLLSGHGGTVSVLQLRAAEQDVGAVALAGQVVSTTAFAAKPGVLSRLVMVCCAADARPVTMPVAGTSLPVGRWVDVHGRLTVSHGDLVLQADSVRRVPTPAEPIL